MWDTFRTCSLFKCVPTNEAKPVVTVFISQKVVLEALVCIDCIVGVIGEGLPVIMYVE